MCTRNLPAKRYLWITEHTCHNCSICDNIESRWYLVSSQIPAQSGFAGPPGGPPHQLMGYSVRWRQARQLSPDLHLCEELIWFATVMCVHFISQPPFEARSVLNLHRATRRPWRAAARLASTFACCSLLTILDQSIHVFVLRFDTVLLWK